MSIQLERTHRNPLRPSSHVPYLLINPPLTDPTEPYHSLPYLIGATRNREFTDYRCLDANIEGLNFLAAPERVADLLGRAVRLRARVADSPAITREDEIRYQIALAAEGLQPDFVTRAIEIFRDPELFYHHPTYRQAALAMRRWLSLLCLDGVPHAYADFEVRGAGISNLASHSDLCDPAVIDAITRPFDAYIDGPCRDVLLSRAWELIGLSVNYTGQLPFALRLARLARALRPEALIVFGGTEVCDVVRFEREPGSYWRVFADADAVVPGEGETPLCSLLEAVRDYQSPVGIRGVTCRSSSRQAVTINYENLASLPAPAYDVWDWRAYWSPEPVILYSPTRGCYWNKCTFCDYGLNSDGPTSPSRERPVETVIQDLSQIARIGRMVYFAVDAMSPRYLRSLARAMAEAGTGVRWAAELRLERTFPKNGTARLLRDSGCLAISFGYESGSQRILDLINKGTRITEVPLILKDLAEHGLGAQMMGFTGFPSETPEEAEQTFRFLDEHRDLWTIAAIGTFGLTAGSMVAKSPERFGVEMIPPPRADDICRDLPWRDRVLGIEHWPGDGSEVVGPELLALANTVPDHRPFAGGVDSAHTMLYFDRHGPALLACGESGSPMCELVSAGYTEIPFANLDDFLTPRAIGSRFLELQRGQGSTYAAMMAWLREPGTARPGASAAVVLPGGFPVGVPRGASSALCEAVILTAAGSGVA